MKRALLLGPQGQLGQDIQRANAAQGLLDLRCMPRSELDLSDLDAARTALAGIDFDVLINCASYHKTDEVEGNAPLAVKINAHLVQALAQLCADKRARFVTVSTDYVFGGQAKRAPLTEDDAPAPLNVYGATKLQGEALAAATHEDTTILRVSSLFGTAGASGKGGNFVETMLRLAKENGKLRVVSDQIMSPTGTADIAEALLRLLKSDAPPDTYHVAGAGHTSWWGFAKQIVERSGINVPVEAVSTSEMRTAAKRPPYSVLSSGKLAAIVGWAMPAWQDALDRYLLAKGHRS